MSDIQLKPCPFCGDLAWMSSKNVFPEMGHRIECQGSCHGMTCWWHSEEEAITAWNMRSETPNVPLKGGSDGSD